MIVTDLKQQLHADREYQRGSLEESSVMTAVVLAAQLVPPDASMLLDVGCHKGQFGALLKAARPITVKGIELLPEAATEASRYLDEVVSADVEGKEPLPFNSGSFDVITFLDVLEHLVDPRLALERLLPLLKPGGSLICSIPNVRFQNVVANLVYSGFWGDEGVVDYPHLRFFTLESIRALLHGNGLDFDGALFATCTELHPAMEPILDAITRTGGHAGRARLEFTSLQYVFRARARSAGAAESLAIRQLPNRAYAYGEALELLRNSRGPVPMITPRRGSSL